MKRRTLLVPTFVVSLALAPSADAWSAPAKCGNADQRCQARVFATQAAAASDPSRRALFWHAAFEAYVALYDRTGDADDLCAAKSASRRSVGVENLPDEQRTTYERARKRFLGRSAKVRCANGRALAAAERSPNSRSSPVLPSHRPAVVPLDSLEHHAVGQGVTDSQALVRGVEQPRTDASRRVRVRGSGESDIGPALRAGVPLLIAGGLALAVGASLSGVALYARSRALELHDEGLELHAAVDSEPSDTDRIKDNALENQYDSMRSVAIATAIVSGAILTAGAVLVGIGGRRRTRSRRVAWIPTGRGLAFHARF